MTADPFFLTLSAVFMLAALVTVWATKPKQDQQKQAPCCSEAYLAALKANEGQLREAIHLLRKSAPKKRPEALPGTQSKPAKKPRRG